RHVVRSPELGGVLVLGTYRHTDLDRAHPLLATLAGLRREGAERIVLEGLEPDAVADFVTRVAGDDVAGLAGPLHNETRGNPFFVKGVLTHLLESGPKAVRA